MSLRFLRPHKTFVGQNLIILVVSLICAFVSTFAIQYMLIDRSMLKEKRVKLVEWNQEFTARPADVLREGFAVINFLVDTSYPAVAINFNMAEQLFPRVRAISVKQDDLGLMLFDRNKRTIGTDRVGPDVASEISKKIQSAPAECSYWYVFLNQHAALVRAVREKPDAFPIGYVAGVRPRKSVLAGVEGEYFRVARQYEEFSPKVEFDPAVATGVVCSSSAHLLRASFEEAQTRMFPLHREIVFVLLAVFGFVVVISSRVLKRSLSQPLQQLVDLVRFVAVSPEQVFQGGLPDDPMFRYIADEIISSSKKRIALEVIAKNQERNEAIARTTQMLAHDVRKPFSMLQMTFDMIRRAASVDEVRKIAEVALPDIQRATTSVNGLIQDVMEVSSGAALVQESVRAETLIEASVNEVFRIHQKASVSLAYQFEHDSSVLVDSAKVGRVFSNILGNAVQAMNGDGHIWIKTRMFEERGARFVLFTIGNSGSLIEQSDLGRLFEDFFTKGKKGGTGLGLAIAHKIVTRHGGRIWCESARDPRFEKGKVEFCFLLPAATDAQLPESSGLPKSSSEISESLERLKLLSARGQSSDGDESEIVLENEIIRLSEKLGRKLNVLLVDDENVYRNALTAHIERIFEVKKRVSIVSAESSGEAMRALESLAPDLVILDVDLGKNSSNGFEIVAQMRRGGFAGFVCIHSNRILAADYKTAIESGANTFLPKPMSSPHLLKLLCQAAETEISRLGLVVAQSEGLEADARFVFIEDAEITRTIWSMKWPFGELLTYRTPEDFLDAIAEKPEILASISCVITDFDFGGLSSMDGGDVARELRRRGVKIPIVVASDGIYFEVDFEGLVDLVLSKEPPSLETVEQLLARSRALKT